MLLYTTEYTTPGSSEDDGNTFITYALIYFFVTLGSLLSLTILVLSITVVVLRMRNGRTPKDTPLLSEEEKIAVMKQTGYVNPTYKFLDSNVKEVWHFINACSCTQPVDCHSFNPWYYTYNYNYDARSRSTLYYIPCVIPTHAQCGELLASCSVRVGGTCAVTTCT